MQQFLELSLENIYYRQCDVLQKTRNLKRSLRTTIFLLLQVQQREIAICCVAWLSQNH